MDRAGVVTRAIDSVPKASYLFVAFHAAFTGSNSLTFTINSMYALSIGMEIPHYGTSGIILNETLCSFVQTRKFRTRASKSGRAAHTPSNGDIQHRIEATVSWSSRSFQYQLSTRFKDERIVHVGTSAGFEGTCGGRGNPRVARVDASTSLDVKLGKGNGRGGRHSRLGFACRQGQGCRETVGTTLVGLMRVLRKRADSASSNGTIE
eukprot:scaffold923_cov171-Amphora_coffeaeformis.AAC.19